MLNSSTPRLDSPAHPVVQDRNEYSICGIDARSLFLPQGDTAPLDELLDTLWRRRQRVLLALEMQVQARCRSLSNETGFTMALARFKRLPEHCRRMLMEYPTIRVWIQRMRSGNLLSNSAKKGGDELLGGLLTEYCRIQEQGLRILANPNDGSFCPIQRYDVDPLISQVAPPSFVFDNLDEKRRLDHCNPYTIEFFSEVLRAAMLRIEHAWPEMAAMMPCFIKTIIHLPDLDSRSCSAQRFAGVVLLSSSDDTLLMVEESLVHECGHQILYCVMELDPLVRPGTEVSFILPWSGAERDAYGYFHATYIYLILALLLEREVAHGPDREQAYKRLGEIVRGLKLALVDFQDADFFTPIGDKFFRGMLAVGTDMIDRNSPHFLN